MAVIGKIVYDRHRELVYPSRPMIEAAKSSLDFGYGSNSKVTVDVEHTHVHEITEFGRTPNEAQHNAQQKLDRFFDAVEGIYGFRRLSVRKAHQSRLPAGGNAAVTYEVVYAIEYHPSRPRTNKPESPYEGYRRDTAQIARRT